MNRFFIKLFLLCTFVCTVFKHAHAQDLIANDDVLRTGPSQTVRRSIIRNDVIPGETYSWKLITLPAAAQGTAVIKDEYLIFTPATGFHGTFSLRYELSGSGLTDSADITVIVSEHNNPANIIDPDLECYSYMPADLPFGIRKKYRTEPDSGTGDYIDAMTAPLVGDLNGDGKPEIVIMGNSGLSGGGASTQYQYINIYNGQTGARLFRYDFTALGTGYSAMDMGSPYHRSPTILALADLDGDGMGEIVMCHSKSGRVAAFKPVFSGSTITAINRMWEGHDKNGSPVSYKAPATAAQTGSKDYFGYPNPYIADLDADGIPEVIVYNKIYNGATGALLMSWQNSAPTARASSVTGTAGLYDLNSISPVSFAAADTVRKAAMTGRRPAGGYYSDRYLAVPAIADIDGDGQQEIITGNRIHRFNIGNKQDHTQNSYTSTEGPQSVTVVENGSNVTYSLSDGFTRVADIDGDGELDIIVACPGNDGSLDVKIIVYVWSPGSPGAVKACVSFYSDGDHGSFSIPFIGDINGKADGWDGSGWTRKLPEICILGGVMHIDNTYVNGGRTGVSFHPRANAGELTGKFNKTPTGGAGHIAGLTWDASATAPTDRLKISWGMEHADFSDNTGITLFDFDNNNAADLCYRDERTLRVISPAKSGRDYVPLNEVPGAGSSVMFSTSVYSGTAFEYPTIADVNMDGSADIVVTNTGSYSVARSQGWVEVYEYSGHKWAPCPPVWNQGMYDPRQVREDLKINARPVPMLAQFVKNGETITPYNGSWIQQPIVRSGDVNGYVPVVRKPNAMLLDMKVKVESSSSTKVTLVIRNSGSASINALTPIAFYDGGAEGKAIGGGAVPAGSPHPVGVDIFPDEQLTLTYTLSGNFNNHLIWARIMDDGAGFPAADYDDCDFSNNIFSGIDCPYLIYMLTASPDTVLCGTSDNALLTAVNTNAHQYPPVYQWYRNGVAIPGAVSQTYTATLTGEYKCYVIEDICRGFSTGISITRDTPVAVDDNSVKVHGVPKYINVLLNDTKSQYCGLMPVIAPGDGPKNGTAAVQPDGLILYSPDPGTAAVADSIKYTIGNAGNRATVRILLYPVPPVTLLKPAKTDTAACVGSGFVFEGSYTDIDGTFGNDLVYRWEYASADSPAVWTAVAGTQGTSSSGYAASTYAISPLDASHAGCYRLAVANAAYIDDPCYRAVSDTVRLRVDRVPNYPDIRVCICPNAGNVNMAKYLDTVNEVNTNSIQWLSQIQGIPVTSPAGIVSADNLLSARVHAFTYSISSLCVSGQKRKFYVETIEHDRVHVPKDTVAMCYRHANAIQINQLFGIEAQGEWLYPASIEGYVNKSASPVFKGAVVMDGKSIYEDGSIPVAPYPYHGVDNVKMLRITYRTQNDGCLHGKEYSVVVVLTQNIAD